MFYANILQNFIQDVPVKEQSFAKVMKRTHPIEKHRDTGDFSGVISIILSLLI